MKPQIKPFREQFIECDKKGMYGTGELQRFEDHPEFLPHPFSKAARTLAKEIEENPDAGLRFTTCLRFEGNCNSANVKCRKLRGYVETQ